MSLKEDTVSADRKERIIFDPEAWDKKDKSGRKTSAITSRQNFDNEKFTRRSKDEDEKESVDEGTIQPSGDSKVDSAGPTQSDTISNDKPKKSNNPQIEFVTGNEQPNGSSSTATGNAQATATGRKIAEALVEKAIKQVKSKEVPFDGPYTKTPDVVVDKSGARHTPMSRVRDLARQALKKQVKEGCDTTKPTRPANPAPTGSKSDSPGFQDYLKKRREQKASMNKESVEQISEGGQTAGNESSIHDQIKNRPAMNTQQFKDKMNAAGNRTAGDPFKKKFKVTKPNTPPGTVAKSTNEEVEQIDEISKETEHSYFKKAYAQKNDPSTPKAIKRKRNKGMDKVINRTLRRNTMSTPGASQDFKDQEARRGVGHVRDHVEVQGTVIEGVTGAAAGAFLGLGVAGPIGALAGGYLGHKVQQGANASKAVKKKVVKEEESQMENLNQEGLADIRSNMAHRAAGTKDGKANFDTQTGKALPGRAINAARMKVANGALAKVRAGMNKEEAEQGQELKTYAQFMEQLLEYTPGPGGVTRVQGKSYGANYDAGEDDDKPAAKPADAPKRGRGRPAGSKSGANQKVTTGKSYGGIATHSLNLPNSNR